SARDLYVETVDPDRPGFYREAGQWQPFAVEQATIQVRGEPPVPLEIQRTVRGPIVNALLPSLSPDGHPAGDDAGPRSPFPRREGGQGVRSPLSLRWTGLEVGSGFDALLGLNAASSVPEALDALAQWPCPVLNAVLADDQGHIAYHAVGYVPRRSEAARAYRDAAEPSHAWQGFIPFEHMPQAVDPPRGWLATANQPPWKADPPGLAYLGSAAWADGGRMRRIRHRLTASQKLSPEQIADVQADVTGTRPLELAPVLVDLLRVSSTPAVRQAVALLDGWDGSYTLEMPAPAVWTAIWERWLRRVAAARFPAPLVSLVQGQAGAVARALLFGQDTSPPWFQGSSVRDELAQAAEEAMAWLAARLGNSPDGWRWGAVHTVTWRHPLSDHGPAEQRRAAVEVFDVGPFPTTGGAGAVRAAGHSTAQPFRVTGGSTYRLVADLSPGGGLQATTTTGQSGHPGSAHYADQAPLWLANQYHPFPIDDFDAEGVTTILSEAE
ncbi:MAG: penicillin acylase family protein, partial [Chloroflexota bacterium]